MREPDKSLNVSLLITHPTGGRDGEYANLTITDRTSGIQFLTLKLSYEELGRLQKPSAIDIDAKAELHGLKFLGKKYVYERRSITISREKHEALSKAQGKMVYDKHPLQQWLEANCQEPGWDGVDTYLGSQNSIGRDYATGATIINYAVWKYVDIEEGEGQCQVQ